MSGEACDHWNRRTEDVGLIKNLGVSHYRFSIEWSRIEPQQGQWNQDALQWYSDLVDELIVRGIQPMVTLHHFTHPLWWDEMGGFEREENVSHWVQFSMKMFDLLSDRVEWWCSTEVDAFSSRMNRRERRCLTGAAWVAFIRCRCSKRKRQR